jgi:PAS domain S-box-containing protein
MRSIKSKLLISVGLIVLIFSTILLHKTYRLVTSNIENLTKQQLSLSLNFDLGIREYVAEKIRPITIGLVPEGKFMPETMSTSYVARNIFEKVRRTFPNYIIKFSSDNPRNPANKAGIEELNMIKYFNDNPSEKMWTGEITMGGKPYFAQFSAMRMEKACLRCHGDPADAPAELIERYGSTASFHRPLGKIVGLDTIAIPSNIVTEKLWGAIFNNFGVLGIGILFFCISLVFIFKFVITDRLSKITEHFIHTEGQEEDVIEVGAIEIGGNDEITALTGSFNKLANKLNESYTKIQKEIEERKRAENALKESEEKYREFVEGTEDIIAQVDREGRLTFVNNNAEKIFGLSKDKCIGLSAFDFIHPDDREKTKVAFDQWVRNRMTNTTFENRQVNQTTGKVHHMHWTINFYYDEDGNITSINSIARDLTERKKMEETLRESEERYHAFFEQGPDGIVVLDPEATKVIEFNDQVCRQLGYSREEFARLRMSDIEAMETAEETQARIQKVLSEGYDDFETLHRTKQGEIRYVHVTAQMIDLAGRTIYHCIWRDITERKQTEEALRESESRYSALFTGITDAVYVHHINEDGNPGQIIDANEVACKMLGYTRDELVGMEIGDIDASESTVDVHKAVEDLKAGRNVLFEQVHVAKNGKRIPVEVHAQTFEYNGRLAVLSTVRDITDRKRAEKERLALEAQLQQAQKMESIGTLAGGIAHDFNNILGIILGNAELAMDDVPEWNPAKFNLKEIRTASLRAKDVVRQLLSFARKTRLEKKPTNIVPIVKESLKLLRSSIPTSIEIHQNITAEVDTILADPTQINQVLINLCTNANHAMPDGGIIEVNLESVALNENEKARYPDLNPGRYVNLTISDTGHGIPKEDMDRIFDPYYTTKEVGKGTGMGLAVVHSIIKEHNGIIIVKSQPGEGTTFSIFFPAVEKEAVVESEPAKKLPMGNEKILFIDDEQSIVNMARQMLERLGYEVDAKMSPIEALEIFRSKSDQFDLVITDLTMPKMTGDKLVKEILNIRPDIPIILCTGFSEKIDEKKATAIGASDYIEKPVNLHDFAFKVRKVLDEKTV